MKRTAPCLVLTWLLFPFLAGVSAWETSVRGSGTFSTDSAHAVVVDPAGNVVAAGQIANPETGLDFAVIKFDATGRKLWRQILHGSRSSGFDGANAIGMDPSGDVIAAGFTENTDTGRDFTVVKLHGATGTELWRQVIDGGSFTAVDEARTVAVDARGDVVVGGRIRGSSSPLAGTSDFFVVKLSGADGRELWHHLIQSTGAAAAHAVAVDATGDVIAVGGQDSLRGRNGRFLVVKLNGDSGTELWRQTITGTLGADSVALSVAVDTQGNVLAAGATTNSGAGSDFTVIKFDGDSGRELWRQALSGTAAGGAAARAVTVDAVGDVFAAGLIVNAGSDGDFTVARLNGTTGEVRWLVSLSSSGGISDFANALTLDGAGNVVAAGRIHNIGSMGDFAVVKFDGAIGHVLWSQFVNGTLDDNDEAFAVAVDGGGNAVAAGVVVNSGTGFGDFAVATFNGSTGDALWRQDINGPGTASDDVGIAIAIGTQGHVVAAGNTTNVGTGADVTVVTLSRAHGAELWRRDINGTANRDDFASAVAVDEHGNVVVAGRSVETGPAAAFTVVKLRGRDGRESWRHITSGTGSFAEARALHLDWAGDVVAAGVVRSTSSSDDFAVIKLDGKRGTPVWQQIIDGSAGTFDGALAVTVDSAGHVVAAGFTENGPFSERDFTVARLDGTTGSLLWLKALSGTGDSFNDSAGAVAVDGAGDVIAAGLIRNAGVTPFGDFTVVKFDGVSGAELWHRSLRGTGTLGNRARAVAVDPLGHVVAAGSLNDDANGDDFTIVKFDGATGVELWRQVINGDSNQNDEALSVSLDRDGHVIAAGVIRNVGTGGDFTVVKLDGATGVELWRRMIDGSEHGDDVARAVVADPAGNIVATGAVRNLGSGDDFTVVKLRGSDGKDFVGRPTLTVAPRVVRPGGTVTATWNGLPAPTTTDWIGIYARGAPDRKPVDWIYVSCVKVPGGARAEGSCPMFVPARLAPGMYELRLFANDGLRQLARSGVFDVRRAGARPPGRARWAPQLHHVD
jgi:uncharacterized delta-60 repeat protein